MTTIVNTDMAAAWGGAEGDYWAEQEEQFDRSSAAHVGHLLRVADVQPADSVLDVGCGCGRSTRAAARRARDGRALGIDLSPQMLERAREQAAGEGLTNVEFVYGDAQAHPFERQGYDLVISSFGCMFFNDPVAAFTNLAGALRTTGRVALLVWRDLSCNPWAQTLFTTLAAGRHLPGPPPGAPGPFSFADPARVRPLLEAAGLRDVGFAEVDEPMLMGADVEDAFRFMTGLGVAKMLLADLDEGARRGALDTFRARLADHVGPDGVVFGSAAWLVTARPG